MTLYEYDRSLQLPLFCGVDEAGRGPLAGDVYAAAVILPLDAALREKTRFSFTLRDMRFSMAEIVGYSIAEKAMDGVLPCQMTLIVPSVLTYVPPETGEVTEST